ncbi:MAG: hypothetical protein HQ478_04805 [Chloroflexi bacterium]|nr:hypothetical protein [Chloroflexota bacterium]
MGVVSTVEIAAAERDRWFNDPAEFARAQLGAELWSKQAEILGAVRDHGRVAVRSCNGSGKTFTAACAVLWWLMCFEDALAITTAPSEHQVRDVLWREVRRAYRGHEALFGGTLNRTSLELGDKHYANGLSTNRPDRFQGFHEGSILFVVDEAPGVDDEIFEAIEGSMTSARARLLLLGNPTSLSGTFYEAFHSKRQLWSTIHISAFDTPNLLQSPDEPPGMPALITPRWVEEARLNWGEESPMYQVRVQGDFPSTSEDTLVSLKLIEAAVGKNCVAGPKDGIEIGVDVARFGSDRTVICIRRGDLVLRFLEFRNQDTMATAGHVAALIKELKPTFVRVDEIGIGAGVVDRLLELKLKKVFGVNVGERAKNKSQFANKRAEVFDGLRKRFEAGEMSIPDNRELISQLAALRYSFNSSGQMRLEGKDELRRKGLPSPDHADALALAFGSILTVNNYKIW